MCVSLCKVVPQLPEILFFFFLLFHVGLFLLMCFQMNWSVRQSLICHSSQSVYFFDRHWICSFRGSKEFNVVNQLLEHVLHHDNSYFNVLSANSIIHVFFWVIFNWLIFFSPLMRLIFLLFVLCSVHFIGYQSFWILPVGSWVIFALL